MYKKDPLKISGDLFYVGLEGTCQAILSKPPKPSKRIISTSASASAPMLPP